MKIEEIPEFELVPVYVELVKQPHLRAVTEKGRREAIAIVSERYNLVQIRELFQNVCQAVTGNYTVLYYRGKGELAIFPEGRNVGLLIINSVDRSTAVRVHFCTRIGNGTIRVPTDISPFVRLHTSKNIQVALERYLDLLNQVEETWSQIVESLGKMELGPDDIVELRKNIKDKKLNELLENTAPIKFWDLVIKIFNAVQNRKYKSEFHLARKLRKIGEIIIAWAVYSKLLNK